MADWYKLYIELPVNTKQEIKQQALEYFSEIDYDFPEKCFDILSDYREPSISVEEIASYFYDNYKLDDVKISFYSEQEETKYVTYKILYASKIKINKFKSMVEKIANKCGIEEYIDIHISNSISFINKQEWIYFSVKFKSIPELKDINISFSKPSNNAECGESFFLEKFELMAKLFNAVKSYD